MKKTPQKRCSLFLKSTEIEDFFDEMCEAGLQKECTLKVMT